jgi:translocation and assembly module TamA
VTPPPRFVAAGLSLGLGLALAPPLAAAPSATVEGLTDGALRSQIEQAVGESKTAPRDSQEARRRAAQAARDAVSLLRSEGWYDGAAQADLAAAASGRAVVRVTAGPRFRLRAASIFWVGAAPDAKARAAAEAALRLTPGAPGRAADILAAEGRAIASIRKLGYADAAIRPRTVIVDHADDSVTPTLQIASGTRVRLGVVITAGRSRTRSRWVARLAPWKRGDIYDPERLAKFEKRLLDTGAYESASTALAPPGVAPDAERNVTVTLVDRKPRSLELGAEYSTTEGSGIDGKWTRYNRLGLGDSLILTARLYDIQQKLDLEQDLPDWGRPDQTLKVGGGFLGDRTAAYDDLGGGVRVDVVRRYDKTSSITLGEALDFASTREKTAVNLLATPVGETLNLFIATTKAGFILDRSNSLFNPTRGWRLEGEADPTWITGDRTLGYVKTQMQLSGYQPLGGGWPVVAARLKLGSIWGGSIPGVPADRRFFAGGGGSVRGYGYQAVGPRLSDNTPEGGLSLTEASIELRQALSARWGVVAFADAGDVGSRALPTFGSLQEGVGVGVRYDLGFGPLRLDLATPIAPRAGDSRIQVYISIGQAF